MCKGILVLQAYLILGTALSGPGAVWVLTRHRPAAPRQSPPPAGASHQHHEQLQSAALQLWDPLTGRSSGIAGVTCALHEVTQLDMLTPSETCRRCTRLGVHGMVGHFVLVG
jgi:hypothetical protein